MPSRPSRAWHKILASGVYTYAQPRVQRKRSLPQEITIYVAFPGTLDVL